MSVPAVFAAPRQLSENTLRQIAALIKEKRSRTPVQRKIDSQLLYTARMQRNLAVADGIRTLRTDVKLDERGQTLVDIKAKVTPALLARIESLGGKIQNHYAEYDAIRALVPLAQIEAIAAEPDVIFVRRAVRAQLSGRTISQANRSAVLEARRERVKAQLPTILQKIAQAEPEVAGGPVTNVGLVTSEGDKAHKADQARSTYNVNGSGIKVGVLSDSYNCLGGAAADIANNDLPSTGVTVLKEDPGCSSGSDEGRAMLQIVHDLAPGAQLYFATAFDGDVDFANQIKALANAGCTVIIDDVEYFNESPFQDAIIAQAVNTVTSQGVSYFSSASNSGNFNDGTSATWEGNYLNSGQVLEDSSGNNLGTLHDFSGAGDIYNTLEPTGAGQQNITLFWSDALGKSANDYDVFEVDSSSGNVVAGSNDTQDGTQDPYEIFAANEGDFIAVVLYSGSQRFLHLEGGRGLFEIGTSGRTKGHGSAVNAFSVAAVDAATAGGGVFVGGATNPVETFSSDGLRRIFYNADGSAITPGNFLATGGTVRQKPDIAAADGVVTTLPPNSGLNPFFGTSAAAPHAGAIAALLKSFKPSLTLAQIRTALTTTALDIEAAGVDRDSGYGIVMALPALQSVAGLSSGTRGDFTGDGKVDILWRYQGTGSKQGINQVWQMNGTSYVTSISLNPVSDLNWQIGGTADFTGDGKTDIVWRYQGTGSKQGLNQIWRMNGTSYVASVSLPNLSDLNWQVAGTGDFTGDGKSDILWRNYVTGQNMVWKMNGTSYVSTINLNSVTDLNWRIVGTGDFTGDGKSDILWRYQGGGSKQGFNQVWQMNGTSYVTSISLKTETDLSWQIGGAGDYTGDGKVDILWRYQGGGAKQGNNQIWRMNGTSYASSVVLNTVSDLNWRIRGPR
ncbi:FG-GAP-like repeat-containing protein [Gloeobacter kilaueensis]|uniref:FG-GAP-like repeat-containing protein n=1 Tax=Gloeobacter kilaueensis TaxID=1416614 RepID=UPI0016510B4C|nr:FG-GAP-like repeat-containing protein [Gloeobacter kilaueensis]